MLERRHDTDDILGTLLQVLHSSAQNYSELGVVHKTTLAWHEKDVSKVSAKKLNKTLALVVNLIHLALQARLYFSSPVALPIQGTKARPLFRCIKFWM
jgi:hypothetical protein